VVPPPTPQGALGWELYSSLGGRVQPSSSERWVYGCPPARQIGAAQLHARPTALMSTSTRERFSIRALALQRVTVYTQLDQREREREREVAVYV
jgi:hypothetical protein